MAPRQRFVPGTVFQGFSGAWRTSKRASHLATAVQWAASSTRSCAARRRWDIRQSLGNRGKTMGKTWETHGKMIGKALKTRVGGELSINDGVWGKL